MPYVYLICLALECLFVPLYLKYCWPKKTKKSLVLKMVCSTLFLFAGVSAMQSGGRDSRYARFILLGLCACWLGDFLLHVSSKDVFFGAGAVGFLSGHVLYIIAFYIALHDLFGQTAFFSPVEVIAYFSILLITAGSVYHAKLPLGKMKYIMLPYVATITLMMVKAWWLGIRLLGSRAPHARSAFALLALGSCSFVLSDSLILYLRYRKEAGFPVKVVNITTYFGAQLALAGSIFLVVA